MPVQRPQRAVTSSLGAWRTTALGVVLLAACRSPGGDAGTATATTATVATAAPLTVDAPVPTYDATTLSGARVHVGGPASPLTLVNVWATWCTSCREEMADLEALHRELGPRGLRVVAVSIDAGTVARVRRFVERQRLTFQIVHDSAGDIQRRYGVVGVPETYLVGRDGRLRWHHVGGIHGATRDARTAILAALAPPAAAGTVAPAATPGAIRPADVGSVRPERP